MKKYFYILFVSLFCFSCSTESEVVEDRLITIADQVFKLAEVKFMKMDSVVPHDKYASTATIDGDVHLVNLDGWCSGFFPGSLWYVYEYTKNERIKEIAISRTWDLESIKYNTSTHDVGFMMNCSFGNAYRLTSNAKYIEPLVTSAKSLIKRFNENVGCIQSWGSSSRWEFPVIIDNMMNLELLWLATDLTSDSTYLNIANIHAHTTLLNHFRDDYSTYHVVNYDPVSGVRLQRETAQGYSNESAWARGQSWGLYGYTMMYEKTGIPEYLSQAENIARYIISRLPEDCIPYWDYDAPNIPNECRDASAGAILASALFNLSQLTSDEELYSKSIDVARTILLNLSLEGYLIEDVNSYSGFLLNHSVGSLPGNAEVDVPLTYADYYYLEALHRYLKLVKCGQNTK